MKFRMEKNSTDELSCFFTSDYPEIDSNFLEELADEEIASMDCGMESFSSSSFATLPSTSTRCDASPMNPRGTGGRFGILQGPGNGVIRKSAGAGRKKLGKNETHNTCEKEISSLRDALSARFATTTAQRARKPPGSYASLLVGSTSGPTNKRRRPAVKKRPIPSTALPTQKSEPEPEPAPVKTSALDTLLLRRSSSVQETGSINCGESPEFPIPKAPSPPGTPLPKAKTFLELWLVKAEVTEIQPVKAELAPSKAARKAVKRAPNPKRKPKPKSALFEKIRAAKPLGPPAWERPQYCAATPAADSMVSPFLPKPPTLPTFKTFQDAIVKKDVTMDVFTGVNGYRVCTPAPQLFQAKPPAPQLFQAKPPAPQLVQAKLPARATFLQEPYQPPINHYSAVLQPSSHEQCQGARVLEYGAEPAVRASTQPAYPVVCGSASYPAVRGYLLPYDETLSQFNTYYDLDTDRGASRFDIMMFDLARQSCRRNQYGYEEPLGTAAATLTHILALNDQEMWQQKERAAAGLPTQTFNHVSREQCGYPPAVNHAAANHSRGGPQFQSVNHGYYGQYGGSSPAYQPYRAPVADCYNNPAAMYFPASAFPVKQLVS